MTYTYVCEAEDYFTLRHEDGHLHYFTHGDFRRHLIPSSDLPPLVEVWTGAGYPSWYASRRQAEFREYVRTLITEPDDVDDMTFCSPCSMPAWSEDTYADSDGNDVCESCWEDYFCCVRCDGYTRYTCTTVGGDYVCQSCADHYFHYCEDCDGYYLPEDSSEHRHGDCDCEPATTRVSVRNDGHGYLAQDTRAVISLPAGVISDEGMEAIARHLRNTYEDEDTRQAHYSLAWSFIEAVGTTWQTREGNFTKRLSRHAYKTYGVKLSADVLSHVGCIAADHSRAVDVSIEVTRRLNLPAHEFAHADSCWWQSYAESRCALKSNGGFALRTFDGDGDVSGRAWILPLRGTAEHLTPTFDTATPDAFAVFNGYGALSGYAPARIVAHMAGWTYRKIEFSCEPMYVNGSSGYLVAAEDIATHYTDGSLCLSVDSHSNLFNIEERTTRHARIA